MLLVLCVASTAWAQYRTTGGNTYGSHPASKFELVPMGGYAWTMSMDVYTGYNYGELDFSDAAYYGGALDINVNSASSKTGQVRLMYRRSDGELQLRAVGYDADVDAAVEYWHIGGLGGLRKGKTMPFTAITLGGTRLIVGDEDDWKFSMIFGLGVKVYTSERMGLMIQGNFPITFTDSWGGVTVGTGGAGVAIGGTGVAQFDIGGGLIIGF
jgi:hypothetical protein